VPFDDRLAYSFHGHLPAVRSAWCSASDERERRRANRRAATSSTSRCHDVVTFLVSLLIWIGFDNSNPGFQFVEKTAWLGTGITYHMGVDGISMLFVILTDVPDAVLRDRQLEVDRQAPRGIHDRVPGAGTLMIGVFCALDLCCSTCSSKAA
jgi:NADH-quinone oxidoreductase subunit M